MLTFMEKLLEMLGTNAKNIEYTQKISLQNSCLTRYFVSYLSIGVPLHPPCPKQRAEGEDFVGISEGKEKKKIAFIGWHLSQPQAIIQVSLNTDNL